ncbi:MAG: hypothetical protein KA250_06370 [Verrucomicrobiales bacterium]|nr:hypothetical protein [Verrucomicrobiales bacterium]
MSNKAWDKFILTVVALVVLGVSALFSIKALGYGERFILVPATPNNELTPTQEPRARGAASYVEKTQNWTTTTVGEGAQAKPVPLFVSTPIVELSGTLIDMTKEVPQLRPPVSNAWLMANNLDFLNSGVLSQDPDGDGFTSQAEWDAKTSPIDPKSHPPYAEKLIFVSRQQQDYTLKFTARPDSERFQILRVPSPKWPQRENFLMKVGEVSKDEQFRLDSFEEKKARNASGIEVDATTLKVTYLPLQVTADLVKGIDTPIPTYFAEMQFQLDPQFKEYVKEGDTFNLTADPDTRYRVTKVNPDSVVITFQTGTEPEQTVEIPKK